MPFPVRHALYGLVHMKYSLQYIMKYVIHCIQRLLFSFCKVSLIFFLVYHAMDVAILTGGRELVNWPFADGYTISFLSPGTMVRQSLYCSWIQIFSGHTTVLFCI